LFPAADARHQVVSTQHRRAEEQFNMASAELDNLVNDMEASTRRLQEVTQREEDAKKEAESLPAQIKELMEKMAASKDLFEQ
jgi:DNA repair ATPase RecN